MKPYQRGDVVIIDVLMLANSHIQACLLYTSPSPRDRG